MVGLAPQRFANRAHSTFMISSVPAAPAPTISAPTHAETALRALELWIELGRPEGRNDAIWLEAEARLIFSREVPNIEAAIMHILAQPVTRRTAKPNDLSSQPTGVPPSQQQSHDELH